MSGGENENASPAGAGEAFGMEQELFPSGDPSFIPAPGGAGDQDSLLSGRTSDAVQFLQGWAPEGPWVLTSIVPDGGKIDTITFGPGDVVKMRDWIQERQGVQNLYFTVNAVIRPMTIKPKKSDIRGMRAIHVDVDPREGEDPAAEKDRAVKLLRDFKPAPTVIIDSGNGAQGFWLLDNEHATPDEATRAEAELYNLHIETVLQADACHNIDRIMRLPGTVNLPGKKKRDKGRVPCPTSVVEVDWTRIYRLDEFPRAEVKKEAQVKNTSARGRAPVVLSANLPSLDDLGPKVSDKLKAMIVQGTDPEEPEKYSSRSEAAWAVICMMVRAGCTDDQIAAVILDPDYKISGHVLDQPKPHQYAARQIQRARDEEDNTFACDPDGNPYNNNQKNIRVALRRLGVRLRYDRLAGRAMIDGLDGFGPALEDGATNRLWLAIDEQFKFRPQIEFFDRVLSDHALKDSFHPVLDYLGGLKWDGVKRIDTWLIDYGGAQDNAFNRAAGALFLLAAVRRVREPGAKFDTMLVLESEQGKDKSTALKVLAGGAEWFTDDMPLNVEGKRVIEALSGKWIVEAGELNGIKKGGVHQLKGFLSRTHDRGRLSYDRREREVPRQCVFAGTTNDSRYLRDTTGNRRFWPVAVAGFKVDILRRDRDQLWAEAAAREAEGVSISLAEELWAAAGEVQDARRVEDPFYESLHTALGETMEGKIQTEDVWRIIGKPKGMRVQDDNERLGAAMRRLGFDTRKKLRFGGAPEWCYVRGDETKHIVPEFGPDNELRGVGAHERVEKERLPF